MSETSTAPAGIALSELVTQRINNALADGKPVAVTYVDPEGRPHLSLRGSVQVYSPDQLAIWVRKREGLAASIEKNPNMAFLYRDNAERTSYMFGGQARIDDDPAVRDAVFEHSPEPERNHDPDRKGIAVIIDLDWASGFTVGGDRFEMHRA